MVHLLPTPETLTSQAKSVLGIVLMTILLSIFEPVPLPVVALLIVVLEVLLGVASPSQVAQSFASDSVIFIGGSMMLALAVVKQHLDRRILYFILRLTRTNIPWTVFTVLGASALMASVMGEHSVAAIMLPVAMVLIGSSRDEVDASPFRGLLLMAIAYGCAVAAIATPSAGARNAVMISYWERMFHFRVGYLDWVLFMYPLALVQVPLLYLVLRRIYPHHSGNLASVYVALRREIIPQRRLRPEDWIVITVILITLVLWIFFSKVLGLGPIALLGVVLCIMGGVLRWEDINQDLNWGLILLYSSIISIGLWMDLSGAADWLAGNIQFLLRLLNIHGGFPLLIFISLLSMFFGSVIGTGAGIALLGPIVLRQAELSGSSPVILGLVLVAGASCANFTPMSSSACSIVHGSGMVQSHEYRRVGFRLALVSLVAILLFARFLWPPLLRFI